MDVKEELEGVVGHFDSELNFVSHKEEYDGIKLVPQYAKDKLVVDVFLEILRSDGICDSLERAVVWPDISTDNIELREYMACIFKKNDAMTYFKLELVSGRHFRRQETREPAYNAKLEMCDKGVGLGFSVGEVEDYEAVKEEMVRVGKFVLGL